MVIHIEQRDTDKYYKVEVKPYIYRDYLSYITAVLKGEVNIGQRSFFS